MGFCSSFKFMVPISASFMAMFTLIDQFLDLCVFWQGLFYDVSSLSDVF